MNPITKIFGSLVSAGEPRTSAEAAGLAQTPATPPTGERRATVISSTIRGDAPPAAPTDGPRVGDPFWKVGRPAAKQPYPAFSLAALEQVMRVGAALRGVPVNRVVISEAQDAELSAAMRTIVEHQRHRDRWSNRRAIEDDAADKRRFDDMVQRGESLEDIPLAPDSLTRQHEYRKRNFPHAQAQHRANLALLPIYRQAGQGAVQVLTEVAEYSREFQRELANKLGCLWLGSPTPEFIESLIPEVLRRCFVGQPDPINFSGCGPDVILRGIWIPEANQIDQSDAGKDSDTADWQ